MLANSKKNRNIKANDVNLILMARNFQGSSVGGGGGMDIFLEPHIFTCVKLCLKCQIFHHSLHLGAVQTLCSGTSAWVPAQNGVVFTL